MRKDTQTMPSRHPSPKDGKPAVITAEQLETMTVRLTRPRKQPQPTDGNLLAKKSTISPDDLTKQITRLYDQSIEAKKRKLEKARLAEEKNIPSARKLTEEEIAESVGRQYTNAISARQNSELRLKKKFLFHPPEATLTPRTRTEQAETARRLYTESVAKKAEARQKLLAKYVLGTGPKAHTISTEEMRECADRLCQSGTGLKPNL